TTGFDGYNPCQIEIASMSVDPGLPKPRVNGLNPQPALAGQPLEVTGNNYSANLNDNQVFITDSRNRTLGAPLDASSSPPSFLRALVPFGAGTGELYVLAPQGESGRVPISLRTSISGLVQNNLREPIQGVVVRIPGTNISATTNQFGSFVLPDVTPAERVEFEVDGTTVPEKKYPKVPRSMPVEGPRDNQYRGDRPDLANIIELQQASGTDFPVGGSGFAAEASIRAAAPANETDPNLVGLDRDVIFTIPPETTVTFPGGATSGTLTLTVLDKERTPSILPVTHFSTTIVQITPFGAKLSKGGKLTFPNSDNIPV